MQDHVEFVFRINFEFGFALDNCGNFNNFHNSKMAAKNFDTQIIYKSVFKIRMMMSDISKHMFFRMQTSILELKNKCFDIFSEFGINPRWPMVVLLTEEVRDTTRFRL